MPEAYRNAPLATIDCPLSITGCMRSKNRTTWPHTPAIMLEDSHSLNTIGRTEIPVKFLREMCIQRQFKLLLAIALFCIVFTFPVTAWELQNTYTFDEGSWSDFRCCDEGYMYRYADFTLPDGGFEGECKFTFEYSLSDSNPTPSLVRIKGTVLDNATNALETYLADGSNVASTITHVALGHTGTSSSLNQIWSLVRLPSYYWEVRNESDVLMYTTPFTNSNKIIKVRFLDEYYPGYSDYDTAEVIAYVYTNNTSDEPEITNNINTTECGIANITSTVTELGSTGIYWNWALLKNNNIYLSGYQSGGTNTFNHIFNNLIPGNYTWSILASYGGNEAESNENFEIEACINATITPIPGVPEYPTYSPTHHPTYSTSVIPTVTYNTWNGSVPMPEQVGPWAPLAPENIENLTQPIYDLVITPWQELPPNLDDWAPPTAEELLDIVNSTIIPDESISSVFSIWDGILNPIVIALGYIMSLVELPFNLLTYINNLIASLIIGLSDTLIMVLSPAVFFLSWIFVVIPSELQFLGFGMMGLIVLAKVFNL